MKSVIACVVALDGSPLAPGLVHDMNRRGVSGEVDGEGATHEVGVALGCRWTAVTPEAVGEDQPLSDRSGDRRLVYDGRIDNRQELLRELVGLQPSVSDGALILAAYRRWGPTFSRRLVGDFALALWDGEARRLVCARDPLGVRPLYYHASAERFLAASQLRQLFAEPALDRTLSEEYLADYLVSGLSVRPPTPYVGARRVMPGERLVVEGGRVESHRDWDVSSLPVLDSPDDVECAELFRHCFFEAVRCRLRAVGPVWWYFC